MSKSAPACPPRAPPKPARPPGGPPPPGNPPPGAPAPGGAPRPCPNTWSVVAPITITAIARRFIAGPGSVRSRAFATRDLSLNAFGHDVPHPNITIVSNHERVRIGGTRGLEPQQPVRRSIEDGMVLYFHFDV